MEKHRVVVTGVGLLCGVGNSADEVWAGLLAGKSGMGKVTQFDATGFPVDFAAEVKGFDPLLFMDKKMVRKTARFIHFAVAAAQEALRHSGLVINADNAERVGVHVGSGIGGFEVIEREHTNLMKGGPRKISPFLMAASLVNMAAGVISIQFGAKGPNEAVATACTTGAHSIGDAYEIIERGDADAMIAGGTEAAITPLSMAGFASMRALSSKNSDPEHACRPFDKDRDGFVLGEGAGILILESLDSAERRGAKILAELIGYARNSDAYHMTAMAPEGDGCYRAMRRALQKAGLSPDRIDYLNAHATGTPLGDTLESKAIENLFGEKALSHDLPISSTKSMTGHLLGGSGGLEAGITVLSILAQTAPPTMNLDNVAPECHLNYLPNKPKPLAIDYALSNSFGFGGTNAALVFKRWEK